MGLTGSVWRVRKWGGRDINGGESRIHAIGNRVYRALSGVGEGSGEGFFLKTKDVFKSLTEAHYLYTN